MSRARKKQDPPPAPPVKPPPKACCGQGCDPCVLDVYAEALRKYEAALEARRKAAKRSP